jgi:hypothetical protein
MKKILLLLLCPALLQGQLTLKGTIVDSASHTPLAYAYCGVVGKSVGTVTNDKGEFEIKLNKNFNTDSLRFSAMGYNAVTFGVQTLIDTKVTEFACPQGAVELEEVIVRVKHMKYDKFGAQNYTPNNCTGFVKNEATWKGSEAAVLATNTLGRMVNFDQFSFLVINNKYSDSLLFRVTFYEVSERKYPRMKMVNKRPIIFKVGTKDGLFNLDLKPYNIKYDKDFFISLECLMEEVDITKFCFSGANETPSFVKPAPFERWHKTKGGGSEFTVKVSYEKEK